MFLYSRAGNAGLPSSKAGHLPLLPPFPRLAEFSLSFGACFLLPTVLLLPLQPHHHLVISSRMSLTPWFNSPSWPPSSALISKLALSLLLPHLCRSDSLSLHRPPRDTESPERPSGSSPRRLIAAGSARPKAVLAFTSGLDYRRPGYSPGSTPSGGPKKRGNFSGVFSRNGR